jgi:hypothetical protein
MNTINLNNKISKTIRKSWAIALTCCLGAGLASNAASAQDMNYNYDFDVPAERQIDRPVQELFMTQTVQTQQAGELQLSVGAMHQRDEDLRFSEVSTRAEYGLTDRLQLQAQLPFQVNDRPTNFEAQTDVSNLQVGATYSILRGDDPISLSAGMDVAVPIGDQAAMPDGRNDDQTIWKPSLMVAHDFGVTQLHADAQAELSGGSDDNAINYNVGAIYDAGALAPTMELNARSMENSTPEFYATPGLFYSFSDRAQVGVGVPIGLNEQSRDGQVMAKINIRF